MPAAAEIPVVDRERQVPGFGKKPAFLDEIAPGDSEAMSDDESGVPAAASKPAGLYRSPSQRTPSDVKCTVSRDIVFTSIETDVE